MRTAEEITKIINNAFWGVKKSDVAPEHAIATFHVVLQAELSTCFLDRPLPTIQPPMQGSPPK